MAREIPEAVRAVAGLAATVLDETRRLPRTITGLPVRLIGLAMQTSLKLQQQYSGLVARGDELFTGLRGCAEPGLATFDEDVAPAAGDRPDPRSSAFDRVVELVEDPVDDLTVELSEEIADLADATADDEVVDAVTEAAIGRLPDDGSLPLGAPLEEILEGSSPGDAGGADGEVVTGEVVTGEVVADLDLDLAENVDLDLDLAVDRDVDRDVDLDQALGDQLSERTEEAPLADVLAFERLAGDSETVLADAEVGQLPADPPADAVTETVDELAGEVDAELATELPESVPDEVIDDLAADTVATVADDELATGQPDTAPAGNGAGAARAESESESVSLDELTPDRAPDDVATVDEATPDVAALDDAAAEVVDLGAAEPVVAQPDVAGGDVPAGITGANVVPADTEQAGTEQADTGKPDTGKSDTAGGTAAEGDGGTAPTAPVAGYDSFSIPTLRGRLRKFDADQVSALLAYEQANQARPPYLTMLSNRLAKLTA